MFRIKLLRPRHLVERWDVGCSDASLRELRYDARQIRWVGIAEVGRAAAHVGLVVDAVPARR